MRVAAPVPPARRAAALHEGPDRRGLQPAGPLQPRLRPGPRRHCGHGANWVVLGAVWAQVDPQSTEIQPWIKTTTDACLLHAMGVAHRLGLAVALKPLDNPENNAWQAEIQPGDWAAWFASYPAMVDHHADLAKRGRAQRLVVGGEFDSSDATHTAQWASVIAGARKHYPGPPPPPRCWDRRPAPGGSRRRGRCSPATPPPTAAAARTKRRPHPARQAGARRAHRVVPPGLGRGAARLTAALSPGRAGRSRARCPRDRGSWRAGAVRPGTGAPGRRRRWR